MILYTSDLHFGHAGVIAYDNRPFETAEEMDRALIDLWNARVSPRDEVYIVGDLAFHNEKPAEWYLRQLNGRKHLIVGNHDHKLLKNQAALSYFESVEKMIRINDQGTDIVLCHFPMAEWEGYFRGAYHIYGHIHNKINDGGRFMLSQERALNCGCMINNYMPASFRELVSNNQLFREQAGMAAAEPE